ncbi:Transcription factor GRAS [Dillenia turbinata]|uniref:Transcription factor GRAS n=1 Tax=Dillenia turbinata TaxID=194707 RepID=A0AAN8USC9_9MAGN
MRQVKIDVWRTFFEQFGMVEAEVSKLSLYQATLLLKTMACGNSCAFAMNRKCLVIGWKGTPILSVSAWKNYTSFISGMENFDLFSFVQFNAGDDDQVEKNPSIFLGQIGGEDQAKETDLYVTKGWGDWTGNDFLWSKFGFDLDDMAEGAMPSDFQQKEQQQASLSGSERQYDLASSCICLPVHLCQEEVKMPQVLTPSVPGYSEIKDAKIYPFHLASLDLLNNFGSRLKRLNAVNLDVSVRNSTSPPENDKRLSTAEVVGLAGAKFLWLPSQRVVDLSMYCHLFGSSFSGLSEVQTKDVELVQLLLASAEKVGQQQFSHALKLLDHCYLLSSNTGNPVQRVVHYFCEALRERINRQSRGMMSKRSRDRDEQLFCSQDALTITSPRTVAFLQEELTNATPHTLTFHQQAPLLQVAEFTGVQAILEQVTSARKVHIVDFFIRSGVQWIVFMQALAAEKEPGIESLKITAMTTSYEIKVKDVGKRLKSFAESLDIPFSFQVVVAAKMKEIDADVFKLGVDEVVAVYSSLYMSSLIARPDSLVSLMRVIKCLKPCIIAIIEVEADHNSPAFMNRFIECLLYNSAFFDCFDACMDKCDPNRMILEKMHFSKGIQNIVACEGKERTMRHVKIVVWRTFFMKFKMEESELGKLSFPQANLLLKTLAYGNSCTLNINGKCLVIGWKGTPLLSVSAWKFLQQ